jgi:hypothetical protein
MTEGAIWRMYEPPALSVSTFGRVDVEPDYAEAALAGRPRERQPDIAEPDDADASVLRSSAGDEGLGCRRGRAEAASISRRTWPGSAGPRRPASPAISSAVTRTASLICSGVCSDVMKKRSRASLSGTAGGESA